MSMPRFYTRHLREGVVELEGDEAHHATGARRLRQNDKVEIFDGEGNSGSAIITGIAASRIYLHCDKLQSEAVDAHLPEAAVAVPKGKRLQVMVEKMTECGIGVIQPVIFQRSVSEGGEPESRWQRWTVEACKQCGRNRLPDIRPALTLPEYLRSLSGTLLIADQQGGRPHIKANERYCCVIGPEGGLTEQEFTLCAAAGALPVRLGKYIMRTETAATAFAVLAGAAKLA